MNKLKTEINVPYKFCENCSLRRIETEEHYVSTLNGRERFITELYCENMSICENAIRLYKEEKE